MNSKRLITKSIFRYKSFYRLIAIAVVVAVAVITGSLVVGDSVRNTLIKRVEERLGKTETVIFSRYSYLDDKILAPPSLGGGGFLLLNGFVSVSGNLTPVMVWGTDGMGIKKGEANINTALYNEIVTTNNYSQQRHIILRLPSAGMVPLGSMFVTDTYTKSLRLELDTVISVEQGGNINLKNEHIIPFNIFVNREELAEAMGISGKINVILSDRIISQEEFASAWNYNMSGLKAPPSPPKGWAVTSDRIFIQDEIVETLCKNDTAANRIFSYLANSISFSHLPEEGTKASPLGRFGGAIPLGELKEASIPYSFITAVDFYDGKPVNPDEIILSDYAAKRLNVGLGDTVSISYFVSKQFKTLIEDSVFLKVSKIAPLKDLQSDKSLTAEFPGLSNVERCTDWNSDLPINMNLITDEDEDYWRKYKNTPKAIVPYSTLAPQWENAFGSATALFLSDTSRLNDLTYDMFDIQLIYPRETGLTVAKSGVDFSSLFLSLGCFILISAAMLMMVPLSEMLFRRRDEINLLTATGFSRKRIIRIFLRESVPVVCLSAITGVVVGLIYTYLVLFLLGNVWKGATHTEGFNMFPNVATITVGMAVGIIFSMTLLYIRIVRSVKKHYSTQMTQMLQINTDFYLKKNRKVIYKTICEKLFNLSYLRVFPILFTFIFLCLLVVNIFFLQSPLLFVCIGVVFLFTGWACFDYLIHRGIAQNNPFNPTKMMWSSLSYTKKQAMMSFIALASGVFVVFSVGLNRQGFADSSQIETATGGFSLWCETTAPLYHNIQTEKGRSKLALNDLPKETHAIQLLKYSADDASCLNLNKVITPNVLGIDMNEAPQPPEGEQYGWGKVTSMEQGGVIPALVDETVLKWNLGKKLGDTLVYMGEKGKPVYIKIAGTLQNSIFQGYILIDKTAFSEIWSETTGSEIMLIRVPDSLIAETKTLISQALNNYGVRVMTTGERLQLFYSVTDTYLTIFLTLGGVGLLLGLFGFIIVVRKNIVARLKEIGIYRSLGFDKKRIQCLLYKENIIIPLYAILTGALGSLMGVSMGLGNVGFRNWLLAIGFLVVAICCIVVFVKSEVKKYLRQI